MGVAAFRLALKEHPELRRMIRGQRKRASGTLNMIEKINEKFDANNIDQTSVDFLTLFVDPDGNDNYILGTLLPQLIALNDVQLAAWRATINRLPGPLRRAFERIVVRNLKRNDPIPLTLTTTFLNVASERKINYSISEIEHPAKDRAIRINIQAKWLEDFPPKAVEKTKPKS